MKIEIFHNTSGYLGGFGTPKWLKTAQSKPITENRIRVARVLNNGLIVEMSDYEFVIFARTITARDLVEILPSDSPSYDAKFGNLCLKFNDIQNKDSYQLVRKTTALSNKTNTGNKTADCQMFEEIYTY